MHFPHFVCAALPTGRNFGGITQKGLNINVGGQIVGEDETSKIVFFFSSVHYNHPSA
jgi:hypothetical protein